MWLVCYIAFTFALATLALAWYPCCDEAEIGEDCVNCDGTTPAAVSLTIAGVGAGDCDECDDINGTWVLKQENVLGACTYGLTVDDFFESCVTVSGFLDLFAQFAISAVEVKLYEGNVFSPIVWSHTESSIPYDCWVEKDSFALVTASYWELCDWSETTVSVVAN